MKILIFGASGMLGTELVRCFSDEFTLILPSRADCDLLDQDKIEDFILDNKPDVVINSAAIIDINLCQSNIQHAQQVNGIAVSSIASACNRIASKLVQISTDHFYDNGKDSKHTESDAICLLNNYAYTKFLGEAYAQLAKQHLIVRTNIIGFRPSSDKKGFLEWAIDGIVNSKQLSLFNDYYASSIDIYSFAEILKKVIKQNLVGLYNLASSEVVSKARFVELLAAQLDTPLNSPSYINFANDSSGLVRRATSLGLNVDKIQGALGIAMPSVEQVISNVIKVYYERSNNIL